MVALCRAWHLTNQAQHRPLLAHAWLAAHLVGCLLVGPQGSRQGHSTGRGGGGGRQQGLGQLVGILRAQQGGSDGGALLTGYGSIQELGQRLPQHPARGSLQTRVKGTGRDGLEGVYTEAGVRPGAATHQGDATGR
jgi:hypothetical protein